MRRGIGRVVMVEVPAVAAPGRAIVGLLVATSVKSHSSGCDEHDPDESRQGRSFTSEYWWSKRANERAQ